MSVKEISSLKNEFIKTVKTFRRMLISNRIVKYKMITDKLWVKVLDGKLSTKKFRISANKYNKKIKRLNEKLNELKD